MSMAAYLVSPGDIDIAGLLNSKPGGIIRCERPVILGEMMVNDETPGKCSCCGSNDFRIHNGSSVCVYCRNVRNAR